MNSSITSKRNWLASSLSTCAFFFSSRRRHTRLQGDWSSDVCSSDLMLAHPEESLLADGRALSDLRQGVTLEVLGEDSMGPLTPEMKRLATQRQAEDRKSVV